MELFQKLFGELLLFVYHCFDRIVINGYLSGLSRPEQVVHFFRQVLGVPILSKELIAQRTNDYQNWVEAFAANHHILAPQRSRFTHYYFYIYDQVLGPMVMRLASFLPFQATYYLNGHSFIEQELKKAQVAFRKNDNAFVAIDDVAALQAAADRLSPQIIQKQLDYWTLILGPKFSRAERHQINLSRFYAVAQVEYCRNFIFKRNFPIHKIFERSCEIGLWRLTANRISELF